MITMIIEKDIETGETSDFYVCEECLKKLQANPDLIVHVYEQWEREDCDSCEICGH